MLMREVKCITHERHKLLIWLHDHGLFSFSSLNWLEPSGEDAMYLDEGYWQAEYESGLYENAEIAELEAKQILPWLREEIEGLKFP